MRDYFGASSPTAGRRRPTIFVTALLAAGERGGAREAELIASCVLLLFAGHETTTNLIGNGALALLQHPGQAKAWRENRGLAASAVEELLRYDGPTPAMVRVPARTSGSAAGRSARGSPVPDDQRGQPGSRAVRRAGPARPRARRRTAHLAFGHGIHFCLGAPLARLEGQLALAGAAGPLSRPSPTRVRAGMARLARVPWNAIIARRAGMRRARPQESPHAPKVTADGVKLYYEEAGRGTRSSSSTSSPATSTELAPPGAASSPAATARSPTTRAAIRPPTCPTDPERYSQDHAAEDIKGVLDHLKIAKAHVCGPVDGRLRDAALRPHAIPSARCRSSVAGAGYGSVQRRRARLPAGHRRVARALRAERHGEGRRVLHAGARRACSSWTRTRSGWQEFYDQFAERLGARATPSPCAACRCRGRRSSSSEAELERLECRP